MDEVTAKKILTIAKKYSFDVARRGDLQTRHNDEEDFIEMPVRKLKAMLEDVYQLGCDS